eukprot:6792993-Pyramimonas_sp.AAC.1
MASSRSYRASNLPGANPRAPQPCKVVRVSAWFKSSLGRACGELVTGEAMLAMGACFHPHHFKCTACAKPLKEYAERYVVNV